MSGTILDDAMEAAQMIAIGTGQPGIIQHIQDRLVAGSPHADRWSCEGDRAASEVARAVSHRSGQVRPRLRPVPTAPARCVQHRPAHCTCRQSSSAGPDGRSTSPGDHGWQAPKQLLTSLEQRPQRLCQWNGLTPRTRVRSSLPASTGQRTCAGATKGQLTRPNRRRP